MRHATLVAIACVFLTSCATLAWKDPLSPEQMAKVAQYKACWTDDQCQDDEHCWFADVDTHLVCIHGSRSRAINEAP